MDTLIRAEGDDLARAYRDPAPDRRSSDADRQQHQNGIGWHRDKSDPWQAFLGGQEPQAVQRDLGHPRSELAGSRDQESDNALVAHGSLKIIRFTKYRREGARHFSSPPWSEVGLAQPPASHRTKFVRRDRVPTIQFRQKFSAATAYSVSFAARKVSEKRSGMMLVPAEDSIVRIAAR